jgi:predicted transposase/invertase (TIGR01784 family)
MENAEIAHEHPRFAQLTSDSIFKKAFAEENEQSERLLIFLLNVFLEEKLKSPIEEVAIIDKEAHGEAGFGRGAIFDIYCKDASGTRFIVEVQTRPQKYFAKRTFFYLCIIISKLAKKGKDYDFNLPKLYSVSFLDFELDFGENCTETIQYLSMRNDKHLEVSYDMIQMVFVILPRFCKTSEQCETIMDKILFAFKNGHELKSVPENFTEDELGLLFGLAEISNFTEDELRDYEAAMMNRYDYKATLDYAKEEGIAIGVLQTAKAMLAEGMSVALIAKITGLSKDEIEGLR